MQMKVILAELSAIVSARDAHQAVAVAKFACGLDSNTHGSRNVSFRQTIDNNFECSSHPKRQQRLGNRS